MPRLVFFRSYIMKSKKTAYLLIGLLLTAQSLLAGTAQITNLQCEYLTNPLGIDVRQPRFTWKIIDTGHTRGQKQTAYQVLVSTSHALLDADKGDLWDSKKTPSERSALVQYAGKPLSSGQDCCWKVKIWDKDGKPSPWSETARFSMGLLEHKDWQGPWIKHPDAPEEKHIWFRKSFTMKHKSARAFAYVASVGYHELYINGQKADDRVLAPALTRLDKRVLYVTYDVTSLLQPGKNTIAIWYGPGWSRWDFYKTHQALRVQMNSFDSEGESFSIASGTDWKCSESSSENTGKCKFRNHGGELIDARKAFPNWNSVKIDDSGWTNALETTIDAELSAQMVEPDKIIEEIPAKEITGSNPYLVDMGKNFTGFIKIRIKGEKEGTTVTIRVADATDKAQDAGQMSQYICDGSSTGTFENRFNYVAGRYITIEGLSSKPAPADITGYAVSTDFKRTASFKCSNDLFNKIYETDLWTFRANTVNGYTMDCPHRERLGYGEVAWATSWGCGLPNYRSGAFYTKFVRDWCDVQTENGWIPHVAPQGDSHFWGGPLWSSAPVTTAWELYRCYKDKKLIAQVYPTAKRWLDYLNDNIKDGLLYPYIKHKGKFLGDWAAPKGRKEWTGTPESLLFNNCVYAMILGMGIEFAEALEKQDDAKLYSKRLEALRQRIHEHFYNPEKQVYLEGWQVHLAFPMYTKATPSKLIPAVRENFQKEILKNHPYLDMGSSGLPVLLHYMIEETEDNEILFTHMNKKTRPGYGYFIERNQTTWPEYWSVDTSSRIHTCYTGIASWFIKGIGGVRSDPNNYGYKSFIIKPAIVGDLSYANTTTESAYGTIVSNWKKTKSGIEMHIEIPVNSSAIVYVPAQKASSVTESNKSASEAEGVEFLRMEDKTAVYKVQAGHYDFKTN